MKKQTEYIFSDELIPKTFWQKILYKFGKRRKLEDHQKVIERPTFEDLKIPTEKEIFTIIHGFLGIVGIIPILLFCIDKSPTLEQLLEELKNFGDSKNKDNIKILRDKELIFYDGLSFYLSPIGGMVARTLKHYVNMLDEN